MSEFASIIELNVGGVHYTTKLKTMLSETNTLLYEMFTGKLCDVIKDAKGRILLTVMVYCSVIFWII